jgi:CRISPR system Cascade subunit CasB
MSPYVIPWVPQYRSAEDAAFLIAALFALHPLPGGQGTLGSAFARIAKSNDSIEQRFVALLNCHRDDLSHHLRQATSLLRSKDVSVDWRRLLQDVLGWDHDDRYVQRNWARDFWRTSTVDENINPLDAE